MRVASRHGLKTYLVCDGGLRPSQYPAAELIIVPQGADAADDWIADHIQKSDICVTNDIPLAARCIEVGARVVRPNGEPLDKNSIGSVLATRNLMTDLRSAGTVTGGPRPFDKNRSCRNRSIRIDLRKSTFGAGERIEIAGHLAQ